MGSRNRLLSSATPKAFPPASLSFSFFLFLSLSFSFFLFLSFSLFLSAQGQRPRRLQLAPRAYLEREREEKRGKERKREGKRGIEGKGGKEGEREKEMEQIMPLRRESVGCNNTRVTSHDSRKFSRRRRVGGAPHP